MKSPRSLILLAVTLVTARLFALEYHVAPQGSDTNPGTASAPFATLVRARDAIRLLKSSSGLPSGGVTVWLHAGHYDLPSTVVFDSRDAGAAGQPILYAGAAGEHVALTGARSLDPTWFTLVTSASPSWSRLDPSAQGKVYAVNLYDHGITDLGTLKNRGMGLSATAPLELLSNGHPMTLAQWPNCGQSLALTATSPSDHQVTYLGSRPERWTKAQDIWAHGFWGNDWADYHLKVTSIDPVTKTVTFTNPPSNYGIGTNRPYCVYNLLEELDEPGEFYADRATGILYFWSTSTLTTSTLQVSMLEGPLLQLTGAHDVIFRNLTFECSRGGLMKIDAANNNRLELCLLRNAGQYGVQINGISSGVDQCEITDCGEDGVILNGGNRATLTPGNNFATNSVIHKISRISWTYHPAIYLQSCGNLAAHNLIEDLPHAGIIYSGNNHRIEYNEITRVVQMASDAGAIYTGRDWGFRGNNIHYNFIHHIESNRTAHGTNGVYLDDCGSSAAVFGNVFYRIAGGAIFCGGGRDNISTNNLIASCYTGLCDGDYARALINNTPGSSFNFLERLSAEGIHYQQDPWLSAYPALAKIPNSWTEIQQGHWRNPENSVFSNNAGWGNTIWMVESNSSGTGVFSVYASITGNNPNQPALFTEAASLDRKLRPATLTAAVIGFAPIPFALIGPALNGYPVATTPPSVPSLDVKVQPDTRIDVTWSNDDNLLGKRTTGFDLEQRLEPNGVWETIASVGPDATFTSVSGLLLGASYSFRIRAANALGSVYSAVQTVTIPGTAVRVEAENPLTVVHDVGINGVVAPAKGTLASQQSVKLYDAGDAIRISFTTPAGVYRLSVRVRSGGGNNPTLYWPGGYRFKLDSGDITLRGNLASISNFDPSYGGCYWGTMLSEPMLLTADNHAMEITAVQAWAVADYLEFTPLFLAPTNAQVKIVPITANMSGR